MSDVVTLFNELSYVVWNDAGVFADDAFRDVNLVGLDDGVGDVLCGMMYVVCCVDVDVCFNVLCEAGPVSFFVVGESSDVWLVNSVIVYADGSDYGEMVRGEFSAGAPVCVRDKGVRNNGDVW